jgi:hypothetical protein
MLMIPIAAAGLGDRLTVLGSTCRDPDLGTSDADL